ncbi:MAG: hypothetical protein KAQ92_00985 [Candidatus Aenigmarchaeota archaeon]|nr:hypothetical protein [Candidatus Aenigmarchaeota archaeon]
MKCLFLMLSLLILTMITSGCIDSEISQIAKKGDVSLCDKLDTSENINRIEECYAAVAKETGEVSICRKMPEKSSYTGTCYENVALKTNNENLCAKIDAQVNRRECYTKIAINKKDMSICTKQDTDWRKDECIVAVAKESGNVDNCRTIEITDTKYRDECILHFAQENRNELLCEDINDQKYKDDCYLSIAPLIKGNLLCKKINNQYKRDKCHMKLAVEMNNDQECNNIKIYTYSWYSCVKQVAVARKDKNTCTMIPSEKTKERKSCEMQVENALAREAVKEPLAEPVY